MKTYEKNMADTALVVKSLTVLDRIDGGGIKEIKNDVDAVKKQTKAQAKQQQEYWKTLSDDGVITVIEKQTLYRETQNIVRSYAAITQQAASLQITSAIMSDYIATYEALHTYLYSTLKVFDDMSSETHIDNRDRFNSYFSNYYFSENFVLIAITAGILDSIDFRVLQSLSESGTEGETAIYRGGLYQYVNGAWKSVSTGAYKGPRTELPGDEEESFFIVSESFTMTEGLIVNGEELYVNGEPLVVTHTYLKGQIYYFQDGIWMAEHDRTNWRYAAAFADVINITGELPQIFQDAIDDLQEQIDSNVQTLEEEIAAKHGMYTIINGDIVLIDDAIQDIVDNVDTKIDHLPEYYGGRNSAPSNPKEGDFFVWTGSTSGSWVNSKIYKYTSGSWVVLNHTDTANRNYYMMALEDILATNNAGEGYFSSVFAQSFFGNDATINSLATKTIYLRQGGYIQSDNTTYVAQQNGTKIDYDGNIDANGNTHIGGNCTIDGTCTIGGNNATDLATKTYAGNKANDAELSAKDTIAKKLGYSSYNDLVEKAAAGKAITDGAGKLNAAVIDAALIKGITGIFDGIVVNGMINARGLRFNGFQAGDIPMRTINFYQGGVSPSVYAYKCIGNGTFRAKIKIDYTPTSEITVGFFLYKNDDIVWNYETSEEIHTTVDIELPVSFEDVITCSMIYAARFINATIEVTLCTNQHNELMYLMSEPYLVN